MKCNICGWSGKSFLLGPRSEKFCPECRSRSRWRHVKAVLDKVYFTQPKFVLLVGASKTEQNIYSGASRRDCISGVNPKHGTIMDLADLKFKDGSFGIVHACHVLEHVERLSLAMDEVFRVLSKKGAAVFCVPIPRRAKSKMRRKPDKQGHWWLIGDDWQQVYKAAGFKVSSFFGRDISDDLAIKPDNRIDFCTKE